MSSTYKLFLIDERDWRYGPIEEIESYKNKVVNEIITKFKEHIPYLELVACFDTFIVLYTNKWSPYHDCNVIKDLLTFCDSCYAQCDSDILLDRIK